MKLKGLLVGVLILMFTAAAFGGVLISRPLPISNLNNAAGANRSNVSWAEPDQFLYDGDSFALAGSGQYVIKSLTIWSVPTPGLPLGNTFSELSLNVGGPGVAMSTLSTGAFTAGTDLTDNPNIVTTSVTYADGSTYQGQSGTYYPIYQTVFNNLNWTVNAGQTYYFGIYAHRLDPGGPDDDLFYMHASADSTLTGNPQDGWNGSYLVFDITDANALPIPNDSNGTGWDKSSDFNYIINGDRVTPPVPEPGSMMLLGSGLATLAGAIRRRMKK